MSLRWNVAVVKVTGTKCHNSKMSWGQSATEVKCHKRRFVAGRFLWVEMSHGPFMDREIAKALNITNNQQG